MASPATHILVPMLIVETYRRYGTKNGFSKWYVFFAGLMGGIPDIDLLFAKIVTGFFDVGYHRNVTHTLLLPLALVLAGLVIYLLYSKKVLAYEGWRVAYILLFVGAFGLSTHVFLDAVDGMTQWFYPLAWTFGEASYYFDKFRAGLLDAVLLFAWLLYDRELFDDILRFLRLKK